MQIQDLYTILINTFWKFITQVASFLPHLLGAAFVLGMGFVIARLVNKVSINLLNRLGVDKLGARLNEVQFIRQLQREIKLSEIVSKILYYFILLIFITASTEALGVDAITRMVQSLVAFIPRLIAAAIMLQVGIMIADAVKNAVITLAQSFNIPSARTLGTGVFFFILMVIIISSLSQAGINTSLLESSFNLFIGGAIFAFALGYGLSSRDVMSNAISGFHARSQFKLGQQIRIGTQEGTIESLSQSALFLRIGAELHRIPMATLQQSTVVFLDQPLPMTPQPVKPNPVESSLNGHA